MNAKTPVLCIAALGLLALTIVGERVYATHMGKKVSDAREQLSFKQARNEHLQLELERLKSPASMERMAQERLAMAYPDPDRVLFLRDGDSRPADRSGWLARLFSRDAASTQ